MSTLVSPEFVALQTALAGEYSLERELGRGGMGVVYLAREVQLDRPVAIKVLPAAMAARPELRARFLREARTAASLSHPNIVPIFRVGEAGGFVFFAMAYVEGETLGHRLATRGPLSPEAATRLLREVAWALAYAHGRGIVHRDIKPDNILIEAGSGRAMVTDFGIAQVAAAADITDPGLVLGTAHFMSPEQAASEPLDGRSDLYSLGVVGFLALSGRYPLDAPTVHALMVKHLTETPPALASVAPQVPERLAAVVQRCLRKSPEERWPAGEALAEALEPAAVARPQLPVPLRTWLQKQNPARGAYLVWSVAMGMGTISEIGDSDSFLLLGLTLLPLVPMSIFHLRQAQRALRAGYTVGDLRLALERWRAERREELTFDLDQPLSGTLRGLRVLTYSATAALAALIALPGSPTRYFGSPAGEIVTAVLSVVALGSAAIAGSLGVPLLGARIKRAMIGGLRARFWGSRLGEWTARRLGRGAVAAREGLHRPTEMALGLAAGELFAALPAPFREQLSELPDLVRRLEERAAAARKRAEQLDAFGAAGPEGADALGAARANAGRELAQVVAALEGIRLDLLRLHGDAPDVQPLTTLIDAARRMGSELDLLVEARREADRLTSLPAPGGVPA